MLNKYKKYNFYLLLKILCYNTPKMNIIKLWQQRITILN